MAFAAAARISCDSIDRMAMFRYPGRAPRSHVRRIRAVRIRLQRRLLFILGGSAVGIVAAGLAVLADDMQQLFARAVAKTYWVSAVITPLGFALCVYLANRFFPNSQGSGIPQAIAAHRTSDRDFKHRLLSWRVAIGKVLLTLTGLLFGASAGREGPTVQIGASIMHSFGRLSSSRQSGLIVAGSAAGVAAAFNTPLAGIMFGIEELSRSFDRGDSALIVLCVIASGFTAIALLGDYTYFGTSAAVLGTSGAWLAGIVCATTSGIVGGIFSRLLFWGSQSIAARWQSLRYRPVVLASVCGLIVAACGVLSHNATYGTGYHQVRLALTGTASLAADFGLLKFLATLATSLSTIPGGIFSPSLAIGAGLGADFSALFADADPNALMLLGMVAYLAGVVHAPITAFIIVEEMTDNHSMLIPLMLAALLGTTASRLVCGEGIYHALAGRLLGAHREATRA